MKLINPSSPSSDPPNALPPVGPIAASTSLSVGFTKTFTAQECQDIEAKRRAMRQRILQTP